MLEQLASRVQQQNLEMESLRAAVRRNPDRPVARQGHGEKRLRHGYRDPAATSST